MAKSRIVRIPQEGPIPSLGHLAAHQSFGLCLNHENTGILGTSYDLREGQNGIGLDVWPLRGRNMPNFTWTPDEGEAFLARLHEVERTLFPVP
ncbi:MAG: hypothetical protein ACREAA_20490 [Candidatus Polarisedimenticolia bacterium]